MRFLWAPMLWLLVLVPAAVAGYVHLARRRAASRAELGTMGLARRRDGRGLGWRRHVPPALFLVGLTVLVVALARPEATVDLPRREGTVILAFDVSNSMMADDLAPDRLRAAKRAARAFVEAQPSTIDIGVVAFSTAAFEVQAPTDVKEDVRAAIRRLRPEGATSLGRGIAASLNAIAGEALVADPGDGAAGGEAGGSRPRVRYLGSAAVILLSDGEDTTRLDPLEVTQVAAEAGVRVFTIGLGSADGATVQIDGFNVATSLNEPLLREIAALSNGEYFAAEDAEALRSVYEAVDLRLKFEPDKTEITALLAGGALAVFLVAGLLSLWWFGRVP